MKWLALVAALAVLPACTTLHKDRRTLTHWNWELVKDGFGRRQNPDDLAEAADNVGNRVLGWVTIEPIAIVMMPVSWLGDTLIANPIDGFKKAEIQTYQRRFGKDDERGVVESAEKSYQYAPLLPPAPVSSLLAVPEFLGHWVWNSTYPTDPVNTQSWNDYWNEHHEQTAK
jgi:hypothetical protein